MAKHGGKRYGAGRKPNKPSESKLVARDLARNLAPDAFKTLCNVMYNADFDSSKVAAAKILLAYAYGQPTQMVEHSGEVEMTLRGMIEAAVGGRIEDIEEVD